jgi:alkylation response protein AidB-like acyl-CoA dehydrogenase
MLTAEDQDALVRTVKAFVDREVAPAAGALEKRGEYPSALVATMREIGLFGINVPEAYGGTALPATVYARLFEEIARGWMSLAGVLGTHLVVCDVLRHHGTPAQQAAFLPALAAGDVRGAIALTEAHAGSDLAAIRTAAVRDGGEYVLDGAKLWITNARSAGLFVVLARTDPRASPPGRGLSAFLVTPADGLRVTRDIEKLGYKGIETCEVLYEDYSVPVANLIGGVEGEGFRQVMSGLEVGRINIAARAVGVARAAFETAIRYSQQRHTFGKPICEQQAIQLKLADMGTKLEAARLLTYQAAGKKDRGERCDLDAGMAKLFASETCLEVTTEAMRILGGYGYTKEFPVERFYRDAPLMIIGEGTNEIQKTVIARQLLQRYKA